MAVVEKKPETGTARPLSLGLASLAGVAYVLGSIVVAFKVVPVLFGMAGLPPESYTVLVGLTSIVVLLALGIVGYGRMGGTHSRPGIRAGIFLGLVFVFLWAILSRWIGGLIEGWTYNGLFRGNEITIGGGISVALSALLGFWFLRIFLRPTMERRLVWFEEAGWFTATTYKPGQGTRVRRGTTLGVLLMTCGGIWVMLHRGTLERGDPDWKLNIPFTGTEAITDPGDATPETRKKDALDRVRVLSAGAAKGTLSADTTIDRDAALKAIAPVAKEKSTRLAEVLDDLRSRKTKLETTLNGIAADDTLARAPLEKERGLLAGWIDQLVQFDKILQSDSKENSDNLFLVQREIDRFITSEQDRERERRRSDPDAEKRGSLKEEMSWISKWDGETQLPVIAEVFTLFAVRDINEHLDPLLYRVVKTPATFADLKGEYQFSKGQVIDRNQFETAVEMLKKNASDESPKELRRIETRARESAPEARPMKGTTHYASLTLLPSVRFTLPLLLLAGSIWLAWRIVNLPTFADFLIATESEMNKVSWTTRSRLYQDTIVVLVTMVLMAVFLFVVDAAWFRLLSSGPIGVVKTAPPKQKDSKGDKLKW
jgi:preprotein translocase SecE subunit